MWHKGHLLLLDGNVPPLVKLGLVLGLVLLYNSTMSLQVLPTNEMKSNLAAHIRDVTADPRRRVFVGAHRRAEAVLLSTYSELPEAQLHSLAVLAGRALGYELVEAIRAASSRPAVGEYRKLLEIFAERQRREDCLSVVVEAATVLTQVNGTHPADAARDVGDQIGDAVEPHLSWASCRAEIERMLDQRTGSEAVEEMEKQ